MYALYILGTGLERFYGTTDSLLYIYSRVSLVWLFLSCYRPDHPWELPLLSSVCLELREYFSYQNREIIGTAAQRSLINVVTIAAINLVIGLCRGLITGATWVGWWAGRFLPGLLAQDMSARIHYLIPRSSMVALKAMPFVRASWFLQSFLLSPAIKFSFQYESFGSRFPLNASSPWKGCCAAAYNFLQMSFIIQRLGKPQLP